MEPQCPFTPDHTRRDRLVRFLLLLLPVTLFLGLALKALVDREERDAFRNHRVAVEQTLESYSRQLSFGFGEAVADLEMITHGPLLRGYLEEGTPESARELAESFAALEQTTGRYDQIRFLDATGMEKIRVDFRNEKPVVIPSAELQDKRGRYYFGDLIGLAPGSVYVSPLDLNIERGKVERPFKPMIRIGGPVYDRAGVNRGVALLNVLGDMVLAPLTAFPTAALGSVSLLNDEGYWLYDSDGQRTWGFMLPERKGMTLSRFLSDAAASVYAADKGSLLTEQGLLTFTTIRPLRSQWQTSRGSPMAWHTSEGLVHPNRYVWKLVCLTPPSLVDGIVDDAERTLYAMGGLTEATAAALLWFLSGSTLRRRDAERRLRESHERLEETVLARTEALEKANVQLEKDVATLRKAEESQARLAAAIDQAVDSVVITDPAGTILYTNPAFTRLSGYEAAEAVGENPRLLKSGRHSSAFYRNLWDTISAGNVWKGNVVNRRKSGAFYEEEMSIAPVKNADGEIINFVAVKVDVSRRASLERAQSFFTSVTSHELRTPLTKLQLARLILEQDDAPSRQKARSILNETYDEFDRLVTATGTLSRLLLGETARFNPGNLAAILGASVASARDAVLRHRRSVSLNLSVDGALEWIDLPCDQELLSLAFDEILSNAVKYSPDGSGVAVTLGKNGAPNEVTVTIRDRGIGISEEGLGFIKDPFFSFIDPSTYQSGRYRFGGGGIGLGLTLADLIVERHGGRLQVVSNHDGAGTTVAITLPLNAADPLPNKGF